MISKFAICDLRQVQPSGREYPLDVEDIQTIERGLSFLISDLEGTSTENLVEQAKTLRTKLKSLFELYPGSQIQQHSD